MRMCMKRFLVIFFVYLTTISLSAFDQNVPTLTLNASGTIWKSADELQMKIGVITLASTAEEALAENSSNSYAFHRTQVIRDRVDIGDMRAKALKILSVNR